MHTLLELAERCEKATGPDRVIDAAIHEAVTSFAVRFAGPGWPDEHEFVVPVFPGWAPLPAYTASLDAALTLVPEGWQWEISNNAIDRGYSRTVDADGRPYETVSELGPWASLQLPPKDDDGTNDWWGVIACAGSGGATPALALCAAALRARAAEQEVSA